MEISWPALPRPAIRHGIVRRQALGAKILAKQQYRLFGLWRLIAALLVMAYHYAHYAPDPGPVIAWFEMMSPLLDMFFVLSGFLIFERYGGRGMDAMAYMRFLSRRLARLYPLHMLTLSFFLCIAIAVNLGWVQSDGGMARYDFTGLPANLLLMQAWGVHDALTFNYVSWSLSAEWFAYLCFPLLLLAFRHGKLAGLSLLLALVIAALEFADAGAADKRGLWYEAKLWGAYRVLADFIFGAIISVLVQRYPLALNGLTPAWLAMAIAVAWMFSGAAFYPVLGLIGFSIYLGACAERANPAVSAWMTPLAPFCAVSFGIYLWHPVSEALFLSLGWRRFFEPSGFMPFWAYVMAPALAAIVLALASARFVEAPMAKRLDRWFGAVLDRTGADKQAQA